MVAARSKVALIKELDAKIGAVDVKLVALSALAEKEEAERALGLHGLCSSSLKCNNEERHLDHEMHALVERKELVSKELAAVCEGLRGRLGVEGQHQGLIDRGVDLKPSPLDLKVASDVREGKMKVFEAADGAEYFGVVPSRLPTGGAGGPNVLPNVGIENLGAIVSGCPDVTLESNARTQAVVDSAAFVVYGLGAFCEAAHAAHAEDKQSESKRDVYEALEAMALVAGSACAVGKEKLRAFDVIVHERCEVAVLTQLNQTFLCPEERLVERTCDMLCQTNGAEAAVRILSALATHMEGVAREMTKSGSVYYILPRVWEARVEAQVEAVEADDAQVEADDAQVEDEEMGGERQGDEADDADRDGESEAAGRLASTGCVKRMRSSSEEEGRGEKVARLAVLEAEAAGLKAEAAVLKADLEGLVKKVARAEAGPYYLEDADYGERYAPLSTAVRRAGGREATVAEVP